VYKNSVFDRAPSAQHSLTPTAFYNVYEECISLHAIFVHAKQGLTQQANCILFNVNFLCHSNNKLKKCFLINKFTLEYVKMKGLDENITTQWCDRRDRRYGN